MDQGAIERNVVMNNRALERARIRNGNDGEMPAMPPSNVTGVDVGGASQAVNRSEPWVGPNGGE